MPWADDLEVIGSEGAMLAELVSRDPRRPVPQYPDWTLSDLLSHTATIFGRTTRICNEHPTERISGPHLPEGAAVIEWYRETLSGMVGALDAADPDTPVWGFVPGATIVFWMRRMVIESGVHRWDAESAFGAASPLLEVVAVSGLDEYEEMWLPRLGEMPGLSLTATDVGRTWVFGSGEPAAEARGTASDLYLRLMARPSEVELPEVWGAAVDALPPPPKP